MPIAKLDHVNIVTTQVETLVQWYTDIISLHVGDRPNFGFPGAWLYAGDQAVVHLVGSSKEPAVGSEARLKLEHFALRATGLRQFEAKLIAAGIDYRRNELSEINTVQINLWDPDGNHLHIDFPANEPPEAN